MDESLKLILLWLVVGVFSGWFYWTLLIMFCGAFNLQWKKAKKIEKPLLIFAHSTFVPTMAIILLGIYVFYNVLINELSIWFLLGAAWPMPVLFYGMRAKKGARN